MQLVYRHHVRTTATPWLRPLIALLIQKPPETTRNTLYADAAACKEQCFLDAGLWFTAKDDKTIKQQKRVVWLSW